MSVSNFNALLPSWCTRNAVASFNILLVTPRICYAILYSLYALTHSLSQYHSYQDNLLLFNRTLRHIYISIIAIILLVGRRDLRINRTCVILCACKARSLISLRGRRDGEWGEEGRGGSGIDRIIFVWRERPLEWTAKHLCNLFKLEKSNCTQKERGPPPPPRPIVRSSSFIARADSP